MKPKNNIYKENSKKTFNNQAEIYDNTFYGKHAKALYEIVVEKILKLNVKSVLDVGCGTGNVLLLLTKFKEINLYGVDLSEKMLEEAKKKLNNKVELKLGDSEKLPWNDETFESIICTDSFHHYPKPTTVLKDMARVLKSKGKIFIGDPWAPIPLRQLMNIGCKFSKDGDYKIYSKKEIVKLLSECGFTNILWERVNYKSFIVSAELRK